MIPCLLKWDLSGDEVRVNNFPRETVSAFWPDFFWTQSFDVNLLSSSVCRLIIPRVLDIVSFKPSDHEDQRYDKLKNQRKIKNSWLTPRTSIAKTELKLADCSVRLSSFRTKIKEKIVDVVSLGNKVRRASGCRTLLLLHRALHAHAFVCLHTQLYNKVYGPNCQGKDFQTYILLMDCFLHLCDSLV